jgi:hypothetical protein
MIRIKIGSAFSLLLSFAEAKESRGSEPFPVIIP